jgi:hypothetical protein
MLYMATFTINIPPMLAYIPYMDPMGNGSKWAMSQALCEFSQAPELITALRHGAATWLWPRGEGRRGAGVRGDLGIMWKTNGKTSNNHG